MKTKKFAGLLFVILMIAVFMATPILTSCAKPAPTPTPSPTPAEPKVFEWKMTSFVPRGATDTIFAEAWADELRVASDGRLDITVYGSEEICPVLESFEATSRGTIEMNFTYSGYWLGKIPVLAFSTGPPAATLRTTEEFFAFYHEFGLKEILREACTEHNIYYLGPFAAGTVVLMTKFPVNSLADLEGKKLRLTGINAEVLKQAGAIPVFFPGGEIYGALEKGVVEGVVFGGIGVQYDMGFHEVTGYLLLTRLQPVDAGDVQVNMDAWNSLPDDLQMLLNISVAHLTQVRGAYETLRESEALLDMKENWGFKTTTLPEEDQKTLAKYTMNYLEAQAGEDPYFAEATAKLEEYMTMLGILG